MDHRGWRSENHRYRRILRGSGVSKALRDALESHLTPKRSRRWISDGFSLIILSDRDISADRVAISSLLAVGTVHHHLVQGTQKNTDWYWCLETWRSTREVHHHCSAHRAMALTPSILIWHSKPLWHARAAGAIWTMPHHTCNNDEDVIAAYRKGGGQGHA